MKNFNNNELVAKFVDLGRTSTEGYIVDFLGCKTDVLHYDVLGTRSGEVCGFPNPSDNFLHDFIEYVGSCYAYETCREELFTAIELGAVNGIWTARSGVVSIRNRIKKIKLCALEASVEKIAFIKQNLIDNSLFSNNISEVDVKIINAAVSSGDTELEFPIITDPAHDYGASTAISKNGTDYRGHLQNFIKIKAISLNEILDMYEEVDLIHVDIQGAEYEVLESAINKLNKKVRVIVIGTHSRKIEGELLKLFYQNNWELYCEQPVEFSYDINIPSIVGMTTRDGGQVWINIINN